MAKLVFGPGPAGREATTYDQLKGMEWTDRIDAWRRRQNAFYFEQVDNLARQVAPGKPAVWAPFPLAVVTCIGIEWLSSYKYTDPGNSSNRHFQMAVRDMDKRLEAITKRAPDGKVRPLSDFIYSGFRNALAHGFYGKWVFITHDERVVARWQFEPSKHVLMLNVYWFYERFKRTFRSYERLLRKQDAATIANFKTTFRRHYRDWL